MKLPPGDRTTQLYDGVWYKTGASYHHVCCNAACCLTHVFEFKLQDGVLMMRTIRDMKETKRQLRINRRRAE